MVAARGRSLEAFLLSNVGRLVAPRKRIYLESGGLSENRPQKNFVKQKVYLLKRNGDKDVVKTRVNDWRKESSRAYLRER